MILSRLTPFLGLSREIPISKKKIYKNSKNVENFQFFFCKKKVCKILKIDTGIENFKILEIESLSPKYHFNERIRSKKGHIVKLQPKKLT